MNKEQAKDQLLQLYENQIQDLTVMSKIELGEMINVWIEYHGYLDFDTDEQEIIDFYNKTQQQNNRKL